MIKRKAKLKRKRNTNKHEILINIEASWRSSTPDEQRSQVEDGFDSFGSWFGSETARTQRAQKLGDWSSLYRLLEGIRSMGLGKVFWPCKGVERFVCGPSSVWCRCSEFRVHARWFRLAGGCWFEWRGSNCRLGLFWFWLLVRLH